MQRSRLERIVDANDIRGRRHRLIGCRELGARRTKGLRRRSYLVGANPRGTWVRRAKNAQAIDQNRFAIQHYSVLILADCLDDGGWIVVSGHKNIWNLDLCNSFGYLGFQWQAEIGKSRRCRSQGLLAFPAPARATNATAPGLL